jgi:Family of unknown function (DUF6516)
LRIENYFERVRQTLDSCLIIQSFNVAYDKRGSHEGFVHGQVYFLDGSILHLREYVDVETNLDRIVYAYQYMTSDEQLVFRYDNTGHHKRLRLSTYPHHKHTGSADNVIESTAPDLAAVLKEIEPLIPLS